MGFGSAQWVPSSRCPRQRERRCGSRRADTRMARVMVTEPSAGASSAAEGGERCLVIVVPTISGTRLRSIAAMFPEWRKVGLRPLVCPNSRSAASTCLELRVDHLTVEENIGYGSALDAIFESGDDVTAAVLINDDFPLDQVSAKRLVSILEQAGGDPVVVGALPKNRAVIRSSLSKVAVVMSVALLLPVLQRINSRTLSAVSATAVVPVPRGWTFQYVCVGITRAAWERLPSGLGGRSSLYFEDEIASVEFQERGVPMFVFTSRTEHRGSASSRSVVRHAIPVSVWGASTYLQLVHRLPRLASAGVLLLALVLRVPLVMRRGAQRREELKGIYAAAVALVKHVEPNLPSWADL